MVVAAASGAPPPSPAPAGLASAVGGFALSASLTLAKVAGAGYVGVCALMYVFQRKLQYFPTRESPPHPSVTYGAKCAEVEDFTVLTSDGETLRGYYWPAPAGGKHPKVTLLQLHGNAGSRHDRLYWAHHVRARLGVAVALLDYRGYGGSTGRVTEEGMIRDGVGIQWASTKANETGSRLVLHLESIGSAAGINAVARLVAPPRSAEPPDPAVAAALAGVVAEGGLSSCVEIAQKLFSWMPLGLLMKDKWAGTCAAAEKMDPDVPFMSMHGERDEIVPLWCGRRLHDAVRGKKVWKMFKRGGHNNLMTMPGYFQALDEFYAEHVR